MKAKEARYTELNKDALCDEFPELDKEIVAEVLHSHQQDCEKVTSLIVERESVFAQV